MSNETTTPIDFSSADLDRLMEIRGFFEALYDVFKVGANSQSVMMAHLLRPAVNEMWEFVEDIQDRSERRQRRRALKSDGIR